MRALSKSYIFTHLLLKWYDEHVRPFPWRKTNDPYKIWLSEIMLQQTQVKTVIPFYNRWVAKYPTIKSVAEANIDSLLKMWEGLGYYARVRNFHSACIIVMDHFGFIEWHHARATPFKDVALQRPTPGLQLVSGQK